MRSAVQETLFSVCMKREVEIGRRRWEREKKSKRKKCEKGRSREDKLARSMSMEKDGENMHV